MIASLRCKRRAAHRTIARCGDGAVGAPQQRRPHAGRLRIDRTLQQAWRPILGGEDDVPPPAAAGRRANAAPTSIPDVTPQRGLSFQLASRHSAQQLTTATVEGAGAIGASPRPVHGRRVRSAGLIYSSHNRPRRRDPYASPTPHTWTLAPNQPLTADQRSPASAASTFSRAAWSRDPVDSMHPWQSLACILLAQQGSGGLNHFPPRARVRRRLPHPPSSPRLSGGARHGAQRGAARTLGWCRGCSD